MPPTPLHVGPGVLLCRLSPRLGCGPLLAGSVLVDLEPGAVMILGLDARLHGPLHTVLAALLVGWLAGLLGDAVWRRAGLPGPGPRGRAWAALGGILGWALHVLLDSPLYTDITPLWPLTGWNPAFMALGEHTAPLVWGVSLALTLAAPLVVRR